MPDPDGDPLEEALAQSRDREARFDAWCSTLLASDPAFAEASALNGLGNGGWQAAVYLLTGCDAVWGTFGAAVLRERSIGPVIEELQHPTRPWSGSQLAVMRWAANFWDIDRWPARFPYEFETFYFQRWITACHLYRHIAPALAVTSRQP